MLKLVLLGEGRQKDVDLPKARPTDPTADKGKWQNKSLIINQRRRHQQKREYRIKEGKRTQTSTQDAESKKEKRRIKIRIRG